MAKDRKTFGVVALELLAAPLAALPFSFHVKMGGFVGWILRRVVRYRYNEVVVNLSRSFPEKNYAQISTLIKEFYSHLGGIFTAAIWFGGCKGDRGRERLRRAHVVEWKNPEVLNAMYSGGRSLMMLSSHTGNWEIVGGWFNYNYSGAPLAMDARAVKVIHLPVHSKVWDRFFEDNRCAPVKDTEFCGYIDAGSVLRYAIEHRSENNCYVMITDQYPYGMAKPFEVGEFLHQKTLAMKGAASIACKLGMSVCYMRWKEESRGRYGIEIVPMCEDATGSDPEALIRQYYSLLEKDIQAQPWNYIWTHRRWK